MSLSKADFETTFDSLVDDLIKHCEGYNLPEQALEWFRTAR
jgi:hypothetical protein